MPLLTTNDELLALIRKSTLVDEERLAAFLQAHAGNLPDKPRPLAELLIKNGFLTVFQASQLLSGKWRGFFIASGKYKLLELLGVGGMGKVYLCEHQRMKRLVAVKVLPKDRLKDPTSLERFEREARAAGALDHPNIVRAHDLDSDGDLHFLVMEYVDGSTLNEIVRKFGPMAIDRACHYISQAAEGLQHAHEAAGLVHRDVKPGNLLLDRAGTVKLLDLGLARFFHDENSESLTNRYEKTSILGTADFLAPEQVGDSSTVDIRADIYSLGVTFYFLLCGKSPFDHGSTKEKLLWHQNKEPEPVRAHRRDVPRELEAIIVKMMAKKPAERYQQPIEVVDALQPWIGQPIETPAAQEMPRLCPALESVVLSSMGGPLSGSAGSSSNLRLRGRGGPRSGVRGRGATPRPGVKPHARMSNLWVGAAAFLLGIGALIWWTQQPIDSKSTPPLNIPSLAGTKDAPTRELPGPETLPFAENATLFVTRNPRRLAAAAGRRDIFETLGEALARAESNGRVVVLDGPVEGQLRIDGERIHGLTIEGRGDKGGRILWKPAEGGPPDQALLVLASAESIRVTGFEFDGGQRVDTLIRVEGAAAGVKFDNCVTTDARICAFALADLVAPDDRPLVIDQVRCLSQRDYLHGNDAETPAAIVCTGTSNAAGPAIIIRHCRFEGRFASGVHWETAGRVQLQLTRFFSPSPNGKRVAVSVQPTKGTAAIKLTLASNTVVGIATLLQFDRLPSASSGSTFLLRSNLLIDGDAFVVVDSGVDLFAAKLMFAGSLGNVARPEDGNRGLAVFEKVSVPFGDIARDAASPNFLRYAKAGDTLALFTAGAGGEPVGVPPVE